MTVPAVGLIDTSALIDIAEIDPAGIPGQLRISAVTLAELSAGPLLATTPRERAARQARLQYVESSFDPLPFDADVARVFGRVAADLHGQGRKVTARSYDAMIAATALAHRLPLVTSNPRDFEGIEGLDVIAV